MPLALLDEVFPMTSNRTENKGQRRPFRLPGPTLTKEQFMILAADPVLPAQPVCTEVSFIDPAADRLRRDAIDPGNFCDRLELLHLVGFPRTHEMSSLLDGREESSKLALASAFRDSETSSRAKHRPSKRARRLKPGCDFSGTVGPAGLGMISIELLCRCRIAMGDHVPFGGD